MGVFNTVRSGLNVLFTPVLYGVVASLALQLTTWEKGDRTQDKLQDRGDPLLNKQDTFDFIIVGGGTSGCVLANRLSGTSERYSVLLLEAGSEPNPLVYVGGLASHLLNRPEVDWMYKTVAQKRANQYAKYKRASWSSGKGLGGSGNIDWAIYLRGSPKDYDNWGRLVGDPSWEYKNFLNYFQRHENFIGNTTDSEAHADGGELTVQLPDYRPLTSQFVWAGKEAGYPNVDLNGRFSEGFDEIYYTSKRGEKQTTYKTFVEPIKRRDNLTIRKFATVTKVLLRKTDNGAYGLEYERHGQKYNVYAQREIILSAGSIQSSKILLMSGIGPRKHLEDIGVKPVLDLPVGRNLQDHLATFLGPFFIKEPLTFQFDRDVTAKTFFDYGTYGQGPLTSTGFSAVGLTASTYAKLRGEKGWPDLQFFLHGVSVHNNYAVDMAHSYGLQEEPLKKYYNHAVGRHSFHILVGLGRPYARGEVRLASRNPTAPLIIDPKYFEDPWEFDLKTMVEGVKKAVDLVESTGKFRDIGGQFTAETLPGCENVKFRSDAYWECYVRKLTVSMNNPVGSCTMGPVDSPHAVVDSELRVIGSSGLRVVDASVMPSIVSGTTGPATIAIAEKAAESILFYWKNKNKKEVQREKKLFSESSEIVTVRDTPSPPTAPPLPVLPAATYLPPTQISFLQNFGGLQKETSNFQQNLQNTLDSLAQFSKTIQESFKVPAVTPLPTFGTITASTTTTTRRTTTTTRPTKPPVQNSLFQTQSPVPLNIQEMVVYHDDRYQNHVKTHTTPRVRITTPSSRPTPKPSASPPRPIHTQYIPSPTQIVVTPSSSRTPLAPTTFRPIGLYNSSEAFSLNVPILKGKETQSSAKPYQSVPIKVYNSPPKKPLQNLKKEHQSTIYHNTSPKSIFALPQPSTSPRLIQKTTTTSTPLPVTTRRPLLEMIHSELLPSGYENYVEIPISSVEYLDLPPVKPTQRPTTTTTTTPRPPSPRPRKTHSSMKIVPAIQIEKNPLETTTTRISISAPFQTLIHSNRIQTIPQDVFITGLQPIQLIDVTTATEHPQPTPAPAPIVQQAPLTREHHHLLKGHSHQQQSSKQAKQITPLTSQEAPIFYVVRKKNKQEEVSQRPPQVQQQQRQQQQQLRQHHRPQRPIPRKHPKRIRRPQQSQSQIVLSTQAQQHYPLFALPQYSYHQHQQQSRLQQHQHYNNHDLLATSSSESPRIHSFLQAPNKPRTRVSGGGASREAMDGIITPAISSPLFQQNVLNQLIPVI